LGNIIKSIDTDGNGTINYTGIDSSIFRILGCHYGEVSIHERREIVLSFQDVGFRWKWED